MSRMITGHVMQRKRRTQILINDAALTEQLAQEVRTELSCEFIESPNEGLVLIQILESSARTRFFLGETLVTEAKIRIKDAVGLGIVMGHQPVMAENLAIIDAALRANPAWIDRWMERLLAAEYAQTQARDQHWGRIQETRVSFDTMELQ